ncbi:hypothetical protein HIO71_08750 [Chryseobacterium aquaticum]|uniref:HNH endonuclease 5 domain-containing protein n=1 Tax=Chryseobacterium aquaticum TaxID=452084 RepID=A0A848N1S5_9FLAO|nr:MULTISPECIES: hypothetical protein [Chryseobacterium]NMR34296.1 hypothetical protein [Chryseobacterium aquaticum]NRQ46369.1 hypothetical protein [Chryseobacterium sp. C-204]
MTKVKLGFHPLKKIIPSEKTNGLELCIWCKKNNKKNVAHIISKNLLLSDHLDNKLKYSVCESCNSFWGSEIEDWIFKYTPIGEWKENILKVKKPNKSNILSNYKYVPNFIFNSYYNEWIVVNHSNNGNPFPEQIILTNENQLKIFNPKNLNYRENKLIFEEFILAVKQESFTTYSSSLIEDNFSPRLVKISDKIILVAKNNNDEALYRKKLLNTKFSELQNLINKNIVGSIDKMHIHFKWSIKRYLSLTNKIAFEFLALIKGSEYILNEDFDDLRKSLLSKKNKYDNISILNESGKGFAVKTLNFPYWITLGEKLNYNRKIDIPVLSILDDENFTISVIIYKYKNLICATVKLFNIEISKLILSKTCKPLGKIYAITYCIKEDKLNLYESSTNSEDFDERILVPYYNTRQLELFD